MVILYNKHLEVIIIRSGICHPRKLKSLSLPKLYVVNNQKYQENKYARES